MTLDVAQTVPSVKYSKAKDDKTYELVMVDYDKMNNKEENWIIWHQDSVSGTQMISGDGIPEEAYKASMIPFRFKTSNIILYLKT